MRAAELIQRLNAEGIFPYLEGGRLKTRSDSADIAPELAQAIRATAERGGKVIIPAFAVGRVEELLYWVKRLEDERRIPVLPVFVDSPMASEALSRYTERVHELDPELRPEERDEKAPHGPADRTDPSEQRREHARREEDEAFAARTERSSDPRHRGAGNRVASQDHVAQPGCFDVAEHRCDGELDADRREVGRMAASARQVDGERRPLQQRRDPLPVPRALVPTVHEHERELRRVVCHRCESP